MDLEKKIKKINSVLFVMAFSFVVLFFLELILIAFSKAENTRFLASTSTFIAFYGIFSVFALHAFFYKSKQKILSKILISVGVRDVSFSSTQLEKIFNKDVYFYLRKVYLILPRFHSDEKEVLISPLNDLNDFVKNHQTYADQNLIEKKKKDILNSAKEFRFSPLDLLVDLIFFIMPLALMGSEVITKSPLLFALILGVRVFTVLFYWRLYKNSLRGDSSLKKLNMYINENLKEGDLLMGTRIDFQSILNAEAKSIFMIVFKGRKEEIQKAIRYIITNDDEFSDWSLISPNQEVVLNDLKEKNLVLLFPYESNLTHTEVLSMVREASKVIVIDTNPGLASADSLVFYVDHDQRLKKVKASENIGRLSGDKSLILKNLQDSTNLQDFLNQVVERSKSNSVFYLVFKELDKEIQCLEDKQSSEAFVFPSKEHMVCIQNQSPQGLSSDIYCKIQKIEDLTMEEQAKSFIANCTYHRFFKGQKKTSL